MGVITNQVRSSGDNCIVVQAKNPIRVSSFVAMVAIEIPLKKKQQLSE